MRAVAASFLALLISSPTPAAAAAPPDAERRPAELAYDLRARPLQGLPSSMAALILSGQDGGEVLFSALALPLGHAEGSPKVASALGEMPQQRVALLLEVDGASLLGAEPSDEAALEVYAYALTPRGGVGGFLSQTVSFDVETFGEAIAAGGMKLLTHLELPSGSYELRLLVYEPASRRFGLQALPVEVPENAIVLSPPLVEEEAEAPWILVAGPPGDDGRTLNLADLLARAGLPVPSALPILEGEAAELHALLYQPPGVAPPQLVRARLRNVEDGSTADLPVTVLDNVPTEIEGIRRLRLRLPLEAEPGSYFARLEIRIRDRAVHSPEIGAVIRGGDASGSLVWTDIQRRIRGEPPRAELEIGATRRRRARQVALTRAVSRAYRTVLQRLAAGDREGAVENLLEIEGRTLEEAGGRFAMLFEAEMSVVESLAAIQPEALVPVARLHHEAYRRSREENRFGLAAHSRSMAAAVAERYASTGGEGAAETASDFLAMVGDELQQARVYRTAQGHLRRALDLDPGNTHALLLLAVGLERAGDYQRTAEILEELVAANPKAPEARLRLGINLLRLGRSEQGRAILERLIREHNPDWVLAVALEELAMERLRAGDVNGAVRLLQRGLARLPDQGRLAIQLAYALDRAGRHGEAREALDRLSAASAGEPSPRHLYSLWPPGDRQEIDESLARGAVLRLPALGSALASGGGEGSR